MHELQFTQLKSKPIAALVLSFQETKHFIRGVYGLYRGFVISRHVYPVLFINFGAKLTLYYCGETKFNRVSNQ